jgi:hypothetical protein
MQDQQLAGRQEGTVTERDVAGNVMEGAMNGTTTSTPARQHDYAYYKSVFGDHPMPFAYFAIEIAPHCPCITNSHHDLENTTATAQNQQ